MNALLGFTLRFFFGVPSSETVSADFLARRGFGLGLDTAEARLGRGALSVAESAVAMAWSSVEGGGVGVD